MNADAVSVPVLRRVIPSLRRARSRRTLQELQPREYTRSLAALAEDLLSKFSGIVYFLVDPDQSVFLGPLYTRSEVVRAGQIHFPDKPGVVIVSSEPEPDGN